MTNIAVIGATGLVGKTFINVLIERNFPFSNIVLISSVQSKDTPAQIKGETYYNKTFDPDIFSDIDIAFFSAGASLDRDYINKLENHKCICIDNSSAFRDSDSIPLIVPEVNGKLIDRKHRIIANPNCSTIQLVIVLNILMKLDAVKRIDVVSFQSVSGAGRNALAKFRDELRNNKEHAEYYNNIIQHIGDIDVSGYCSEEIKIIKESRKILNSPSLDISSTTMRVPVDIGHTEAVSVIFEHSVEINDIENIFKLNTNVIRFCDNINNDTVKGNDLVYVSRLRKDISNNKQIHFTITADNLRVGAATNAIKIAEELI